MRLPNHTGVREVNVILVILDSLRKDHLGVYGNDQIKTPNLDALAGESLLFSRAYPESLPTLCARRAIHTGMRTWPFRDIVKLPGETFQPAGWQPIPEVQTTVSEVLFQSGYTTTMFADTQPLFHPSMNFQRGFGVFEWMRGQERDRFRPKLGVPEEQIRQRTVPGIDATWSTRCASTWPIRRIAGPKRTGSPRDSSPGAWTTSSTRKLDSPSS